MLCELHRSHRPQQTLKKERIDKLLVQRGLVQSRQRAVARLMAGDVLVAENKVTKAGTRVPVDAPIRMLGDAQKYVSRGGDKLEQALDAFSLDVKGLICADVGASTGGFTDCVLQRGAARVYAIDVGYGQLAWKLRADERVVVLERTNIRTVPEGAVPEPVDLAVIDCSFIGLDKVLPHTAALLSSSGEVVALVKPQFEAGREGVGKGGVVRDPDVRLAAIQAVIDFAESTGFEMLDGTDCDTHGPSGNVEYLLHLRRRDQTSGH